MHSVKYDGVTWQRKPSGHLHNRPRGYLHRYIWTQANGVIPDGMVIHHIDENPANNDLSNLEVMLKSEHQRLHATGRRSTEIQRMAAGESLKSRWVEKSGECLQCKIVFTTRALVSVGKFCSSKCRESWRNQAFIPESRCCSTCKNDYIAKKSFQKYCSKDCRNKSTYRVPRIFGIRNGRKRRTLAESANI